jgi:hypothetical protein
MTLTMKQNYNAWNFLNNFEKKLMLLFVMHVCVRVVNNLTFNNWINVSTNSLKTSFDCQIVDLHKLIISDH